MSVQMEEPTFLNTPFGYPKLVYSGRMGDERDEQRGLSLVELTGRGIFDEPVGSVNLHGLRHVVLFVPELSNKGQLQSTGGWARSGLLGSDRRPWVLTTPITRSRRDPQNLPRNLGCQLPKSPPGTRKPHRDGRFDSATRPHVLLPPGSRSGSLSARPSASQFSRTGRAACCTASSRSAPTCVPAWLRRARSRCVCCLCS